MFVEFFRVVLPYSNFRLYFFFTSEIFFAQTNASWKQYFPPTVRNAAMVFGSAAFSKFESNTRVNDGSSPSLERSSTMVWKYEAMLYFLPFCFISFETVFFVLRSFSTKNNVNMQNAKEKWIRVGDCIEKIYVPISICTYIFPREGRTEKNERYG